MFPRFSLLFIFCLLSGGCDTPPDPTAEGDEADAAVPFHECDSNDDCMDERLCKPVYPGEARICTSRCGAENPCQEGYTCEIADHQGISDTVCLPVRAEGQECRFSDCAEGMDCINTSPFHDDGPTACVRICDDPRAFTCNPEADQPSLCLPAGDSADGVCSYGNAQFGQPCTFHGQCRGNLCTDAFHRLAEPAVLDGLCSAFCEDDNDCREGGMMEAMALGCTYHGTCPSVINWHCNQEFGICVEER